MSTKIKAVFFDRDGTLIHEKPGTYLSDPAAVKLYAPVKPALQRLARAGFEFFIVSNQSGIGRGYFTENKVNKVHARLRQLLKPIQVCDIVFCHHTPTQKRPPVGHFNGPKCSGRSDFYALFRTGSRDFPHYRFTSHSYESTRISGGSHARKRQTRLQRGRPVATSCRIQHGNGPFVYPSINRYL